MKKRISEIAELISAEVVGTEDEFVQRIVPLEGARPGDLSFYAPTALRTARKLLDIARSCEASAIIVPKADSQIRATQLVVKQPIAAVIQLSEIFFRPSKPALGVAASACVSPNAIIGEGVRIADFCSIADGVIIEDEVILHPHVTVYAGAVVESGTEIHSGAVIREFARVGSNCLIGNGVVIGGDGFGFIPDAESGHRRIPHIGNVVIERGVDIGANTTIDRATYGETRIHANCKIDNLVMIGHNVSVGERTLICGQTGISGSSSVGSDVVLAGQVGVADHVAVGNRVRAAAKSGIAQNVDDGTDVAGIPAIAAGDWRRSQARNSKRR